MATGEYKLRVSVDGAEAAKGQLTELGKSVSGVGSQIKSMMGQFIGIYAAVKSVKAISSAIIEEEDAVAGLNASLRMTETYSAEFSQSLQDNASALQAMTVYGDEAIMMGTALMQNIGHLAQDQLPAAQKAALGLAAAYNMDLQTAFQMVGKAAAGNTATLARYGIVLEEGLSAQEKFSKILEIGAQSFGLAEAAAKTTGGQLKQLQNTWGDMLETIGALLAPLLTAFVAVFKPMVEWFGKLNGTIKATLILVPLLIVGWKALAASTIATTIATGGFSAAMVTASAAVKAFFASIGPVGWAIIGVGAAIAGLSLVFKDTEREMSATEQATAATAKAMKDVQSVADAEAETFKVLTDRLLKMKKAEDSTKTSKREMKTIIDNLNRNYGQYLGNLDLERASYDQIAAAATKAANAIASKKLAEGFGNLAAAQAKKVAELRLQYDKLFQETLKQNYFDTLRGQEGGGQGGGADYGDFLVNRNNKNLAAVKANLDAAEAELKRIVKAYTDAMTAADLFAEGDKTPGDIGDIIAKENPRLALARELIANTKLLGLTEQQYFDERRVLLADALEQYKNYGMDQSYIDLIRATEEKKWAAEYKELMSQMPENLAAYYEEMKFLDADYYGLRKEQIINYVEALGLSAEQQVLLMGKMFKDLDEEQKEFLDSTKATGIAWEDHVNAVLETYMELGATQAEYEKWRTLQIENEIRALADLGVDSELLNVLLRQRLDLLGQEYEAYQKLRDEAAMDAWIEQHELQYDLISNTVDIVTEGFATMIREGKKFGETMKDIWKDWVAMAIQEVQRLVAKLTTAFIIKKLIQAADIATGGIGTAASAGAGAIVPELTDAAWLGANGLLGANTGGGIGITTTGGQGATLNQVVLELQQLRRDVYQAQPNSVKMDFKRGELSYAVDKDKRYRVAMA